MDPRARRTSPRKRNPPPPQSNHSAAPGQLNGYSISTQPETHFPPPAPETAAPPVRKANPAAIDEPLHLYSKPSFGYTLDFQTSEGRDNGSNGSGSRSEPKSNPLPNINARKTPAGEVAKSNPVRAPAKGKATNDSGSRSQPKAKASFNTIASKTRAGEVAKNDPVEAPAKGKATNNNADKEVRKRPNATPIDDLETATSGKSPRKKPKLQEEEAPKPKKPALPKPVAKTTRKKNTTPADDLTSESSLPRKAIPQKQSKLQGEAPEPKGSALPKPVAKTTRKKNTTPADDLREAPEPKASALPKPAAKNPRKRNATPADDFDREASPPKKVRTKAELPKPASSQIPEASAKSGTARQQTAEKGVARKTIITDELIPDTVPKNPKAARKQPAQKGVARKKITPEEPSIPETIEEPKEGRKQTAQKGVARKKNTPEKPSIPEEPKEARKQTAQKGVARKKPTSEAPSIPETVQEEPEKPAPVAAPIPTPIAAPAPTPIAAPPSLQPISAEIPHDLVKIFNMIKDGGHLVLPEIEDENDKPLPWTANRLMLLYLYSYEHDNHYVCDLVVDVWIRAFQERTRDFDLPELWRPNRFHTASAWDSSHRIGLPEMPLWQEKQHLPPLDADVTEPDMILLNKLYQHTAESNPARLFWADCIALIGGAAEDWFLECRKMGVEVHPDLLFNVMITSLSLSRRWLTLQCEEVGETSWCSRYHMHPQRGIECHRSEKKVQEFETLHPMEIEDDDDDDDALEAALLEGLQDDEERSDSDSESEEE